MLVIPLRRDFLRFGRLLFLTAHHECRDDGERRQQHALTLAVKFAMAIDPIELAMSPGRQAMNVAAASKHTMHSQDSAERGLHFRH